MYWSLFAVLTYIWSEVVAASSATLDMSQPCCVFVLVARAVAVVALALPLAVGGRRVAVAALAVTLVIVRRRTAALAAGGVACSTLRCRLCRGLARPREATTVYWFLNIKNSYSSIA